MSIELLERGAAALGELVDDVVFVGGATLALWITDPAAPPVRPTKDVDVIVEIATRREYYKFEKRLRALGFANHGTVICRWIKNEPDLMLDAMPTDAGILGFENRWQKRAFPTALARDLPSGARIRAASPPFLLATKLEAFKGRGRGDLLASHDFADIVSLFDGRGELVGELRGAPFDLREYVAAEVSALLEHEPLLAGIHAQLPPDAASQARAQATVLPRLREATSI
jgi:predicted nucleotidyltransferase